jgi:alpha-glucosidase
MSNSAESRPWWRDAVIYQLYLRSFADADGDGIGDLAGLASRLDYLTALGVDGVWLNPCYPSPQVDHGYDVADYTAIDPAYGDLAVFEKLVAEAHSRGLRVLMDLVPNHCSAQHAWFRAALQAGRGSPERERFLFRDGRGAGGEEPPNNWRAAFGGPAWTRVSGPDGEPEQWYLHLFDPAQPDFNWRNGDVVEMFDEVLRFWFDRGVDGFRIDVAHGLVKAPGLPDWHGDAYNAAALNQPEVHDVYRRWRRIADSYGSDRAVTFVGEIWVPTVADLAGYLRPDELQQAFFFDLLAQPWDATSFRASIDLAFAEIGPTAGTITWVLSNHDVHRAVSRYGLVRAEPVPDGLDPKLARIRPRGEVDAALGGRRARAAALLLLALPGSAYLYQGEELGLPEVLDLPGEARQDPNWERSGHLDPGRDGCRVPLPWSTEPDTLGFSPPGARAHPWLPQPGWFGTYAVSEQRDDTCSTLSLYRAALRLRRQVFPPEEDAAAWVDVPGRDDVVAFRRGPAISVTVFGGTPLDLPPEWGEVALASSPVGDRRLPGNATAWVRGQVRASPSAGGGGSGACRNACFTYSYPVRIGWRAMKTMSIGSPGRATPMPSTR